MEIYIRKIPSSVVLFVFVLGSTLTLVGCQPIIESKSTLTALTLTSSAVLHSDTPEPETQPHETVSVPPETPMNETTVTPVRPPTETPVPTQKSPYNPVLEWGNKVSVHFDFSEMSNEVVTNYFTISNGDYKINENGLTWNTDDPECCPDWRGYQTTIKFKGNVPYNVNEINIEELLVYFSLNKPDDFAYVKDMDDAFFNESNFFYLFTCQNKEEPLDVKFTVGATTWQKAVSCDKDGVCSEDRIGLNNDPDVRRNTDRRAKWETKYFVVVIPIGYDEGTAEIFGEKLMLYSSEEPFSIMNAIDGPEVLSAGGSNPAEHDTFNCYSPKFGYFGIWNEWDTGINITIHDIYVNGHQKN